jgi:glucosamine--fructose-6-phosphate aminotransferase (isomerizing)
MCGIVGYVGQPPVVTTVLDALSRLEYRGYDSAGIAVLNGNGLSVRKRVGKLKELLAALQERPLDGHLAVAHTRWATHGEPTEVNAHPHLDCSGKLALVHNGIVENYAEIKERLMRQGHTFRSKTDTEVMVHLIEEYAKGMPLGKAFRKALSELRGSYAVCMISSDEPERLFGARCGSPLIVGIGKGESFFASDVTAVLARTRQVIYLNDLDVVELTAEGAHISTLSGRKISRPISEVTWNLASAQKEGHPHFMVKEIHEQPQAIEQTLLNRLLPGGKIAFDKPTEAFLKRLTARDERVVIIACGTAYHAGLVGEYMLEEFAKIPVVVDLASEFRYRGPMLDRKTTVIAVTQSGETADTLAGVRLAKARGAKVLAICNVVGSSIAREADAVIYTHAGPEIAVASTKAYTTQLTTLCLLTLYLAKARGLVTPSRWKALTKQLAQLPELMKEALTREVHIRHVAQRFHTERNFYYLGRRYNYPSALEGALKLKEICPIIHAEGYAAGEMKHGPISLIRKGWPVVVIATDSPVSEKLVSNIEEVRARQGECIVIASEGREQTLKRHADGLITVPLTEELFSPILAAVPLQLLAYHIADANHCDIDQPPNLAKSVTVE